MRLSGIQAAIGPAEKVGDGDPEVRGIAYDSRRVRPGDLFVCVRGFKSDGGRFLPDALARGARAAIVEPGGAGTDPEGLPVPALVVPSARAALARAAAALHGFPSRELELVGVTGTNGKTTTTYLVEGIARAGGRRTGVIGTIGCRIGDESLPGERTTPEAPDLQALLRGMVDEGVRTVAMEVSSHALALRRTLGCEFTVGVFTNLTQDHLDFHGDFEEYFAAKALLFTEYPRESERPFVGVINRDDPYGRQLIERCDGRVLSYGRGPGADLRATEVGAGGTGIRYIVEAEGERHAVEVPIGGLFNVYNSLAALGAARAIGLSWEVAVAGLAASARPPGRFEPVDGAQPFTVIVDYAHSPDGLENVLQSARALNPRRLAVVFGCGGDRDRTKRPQMGAIAARLADRVFVTSDNPRSEEPEAILGEILAGIGGGERRKVTTEVDRRSAIFQAVGEAEAGDLIVVAGKGHEDYQIFRDGTVHFDDREVAREAIRAREVVR